ncbi:DNA polymerase III subunit gamma/tau [Fontivita pretiosa]|uniref:DNA polymerase III subunit gamma/tau n=1 Tax=Fontivita pretiosa TaxID=2989684 RepID=UPI003D18399E
MSYIVLARKYRSNTFDEVVGQSHVAQTLKRAIQTGRIAHAYLFCGTRGVGKTSMARILAKALNCQKSASATTEPCGKCSSCEAIARGEDIDVIEIDAASNTQVDKTREVIIENVQYRPAHSRFKVFIIDEVHMLSKASFNALLKTMEEPPEHVKFILATTEPEKVPPTILSRCQRFDFRNIPTREIAEHLKQICRAEGIQASEDALLLVAKAGAGSMRDALSLLDRLLSIGEKQISVELIEQSLGMPRAQAIYELVQSIGLGDVKAVLEGAEKLISRGLSPDTLVVSLADHLRNLLILRTCGPGSQLVEVAGIAIEELTRQAERFEPQVLTQDIAILEELRRHLRASQAGRALLDATLVRLALAEQFTSVQELLRRVDGSGSVAAPAGQKKKFEPALSQDQIPSQPAGHTPGRQQIAPQAAADSGSDDEDDDALPAVGKVWNPSGPSLSELLRQQQSAADAAAQSPDAATEPDVSSAEQPPDLSSLWKRLIALLASKGPGLTALLKDATLAGIEDGLAIVRYPPGHEPAVRMLDRNGKKDVIRDALSELLKQKVGVKFEVGGEAEAAPARQRDEPPVAASSPAMPRRQVARYTPAPPPAPLEPTVKITEELRQQLRSDELIRAVMDMLGGEIVKVE